MYYVYIIESTSTGKWYYGYTERLAERINDHNSNHHHFTGGKGPWTIIFQRTFNDKSEALRFEKELKKLRNKDYIKRQFGEYFIEKP